MVDTNAVKKAGGKKTLKKKSSAVNSVSSSMSASVTSMSFKSVKTDKSGLANIVDKIANLKGSDWMQISQHKKVKSNAASDYITSTATNVCTILSLACNSWPATVANFSSSKKTLLLLESYDPSIHSLSLAQQHPPPYEVPKDSPIRYFGHWVLCCLNLQSKIPVPLPAPLPTPATKGTKTAKRKKALEKLVATMDDSATEPPEAIEAEVTRREEEQLKITNDEIKQVEAVRVAAQTQLKQELDQQRDEQNQVILKLEERERKLQQKEQQLEGLEQQQGENQNDGSELAAKQEELLQREQQIALEEMSQRDRLQELQRREHETENARAELTALSRSAEEQQQAAEEKQQARQAELERKREQLDQLESERRAQEEADLLKQEQLRQREATLQSELQKVESLKEVEAEIDKRQLKVIQLEHYLERKGIMNDVMIVRQQVREIQNEETERLQIQREEDFEITQRTAEISNNFNTARILEHKSSDPPPPEQEVDEKVNAVLSERRKRDQRKSLEYGLALARQSQEEVFSERGGSLSPRSMLYRSPQRSVSPRAIHSPPRESRSMSPSGTAGGYAPVTPPVTKYSTVSMSQTPPLTLPRLGGPDRLICTSPSFQHSIVVPSRLRQSPEAIDRDTELPQTEHYAESTIVNEQSKIVQFKTLALQQHYCINECYAFLNSPHHKKSWSYSDPTPSPDSSLSVPQLQGVFNAPPVSQIATLHNLYEGNCEEEESSLKSIVREQHKHLVALAARCEDAGMLPSADFNQLLGNQFFLSPATSPRLDTSA